MEKVSEICKNAYALGLRRGEAVFCSSKNGKDSEIPLINSGELCIATKFYSSGKKNPEVYVDAVEMFNCPYRCVSLDKK